MTRLYPLLPWALCVLGAVCCLSACGPTDPLTAGYVLRRDHHSAYTTMVCNRVGNATICTPIYHPERFSVTLGDGEHDERTIDMRREEWRSHPPGAWVCLTRRCTHPHDDGER